MKIKWLIISTLLLFIYKSSISQEPVEVSVEQKEMSQGEQTAFIVFVPESEPKMVEKEWKKFINERSIFEFATKGTSQTVEKAFLGVSNIFSKEKKSYDKKSLKVEKVEDELVVKNVMHEDLTSSSIDVYARIVGMEDGVFLNSFFKYSDSIFISESNISEDAQATIKNYIREFGVETYRVVVQEQVDAEKKILRKLEGDLKDLERKNKSLHKSIGSYESEIDEYNYNITTLQNDLVRIEAKRTEYKELLDETSKTSLDYDSVKDNLRDKDNERKKNLNKTKSFKKKISRNKTNIQNANSDILENEKDQELQREAIRNQQLQVEEYENKLLSIS